MENKKKNATKSSRNPQRTSLKNASNKHKKQLKEADTVMIKDRKKKVKASKIITLFFFIGIFIVGIYLLLTLPEFNLKDINLNETSNYSKEEIIQKTGLEIGKNIFIQYFTCDKKEVTTLPYIESIKLKMKLPNVVNIEIVKRIDKYYGYDKDNNTFYKLSEDGYILEKADISSKKNDEILLLGITFDDNVMLGNKINDIDLSKIYVYKRIENEFNKDGINGKITKVSFENSLTTLTINDKLSVIFPNDTQLEYKMNFLKGILSKIGEDSVGVIDMTKTNPTYSSF